MAKGSFTSDRVMIFMPASKERDHKISKSDMLDKSVRTANNYLYDTPYLILDFVRYVQSNLLQENVLIIMIMVLMYI